MRDRVAGVAGGEIDCAGLLGGTDPHWSVICEVTESNFCGETGFVIAFSVKGSENVKLELSDGVSVGVFALGGGCEVREVDCCI